MITLTWTSYEGREELYAPPEDSDEVGGLRTTYFKIGAWSDGTTFGYIETPCDSDGNALLTDDEIIAQWQQQT